MERTYYGAIHENGLRMCEIKISEGETSTAIFHRWVVHRELVVASPMVGGHPGGTIELTMGLVEFLDGKIAEVIPNRIRFLDTTERFFNNKR